MTDDCPDCSTNTLYSYEVNSPDGKTHFIKICFICGYYYDNGNVFHKEQLQKLLRTPEFAWMLQMMKELKVNIYVPSCKCSRPDCRICKGV